MSRPTSSAPGKSIKALTPSDSTDFSPRPRGIVVGSGIIVFVNEDDTTETIADGTLTPGVVYPISPKRINSTGTTATILYGIY